MNAYENNGSQREALPPSFWDDFTVLGVPRNEGQNKLEDVKEKLEPNYEE